MYRIVWAIIVLLSMAGVVEAQVSQGTVFSKTEDGNGNKITSAVVGATRGLDINCIAGCGGAGGATEATLLLLNAKFATGYLDADGIVNQTTTAVHGQGYMFNGATWDRVRGTIAGGLLVNISNASLAVTGTFFQATQPVSGTFWQATQPVSGTVAVSNLFLLDATYTGRMPAAANPADNETNVASISRIGNYNFIFDGAAWDRWTGAVSQSGTWNIGTVTTVTTVAAVTAITNALPTGTNTIGNVTTLSTVASANNDGTCPNGAASFTVVASNASRTWLAIWASPANTDDVFIKLAATATNADGRLAPGQAINFTSGRIYTGIVDAFPNSGTQAVCVMELN